MHRLAAALACAAVTTLAGADALAGPYRLPWAPGTKMDLTQDCNDGRFDDHVGSRGFAWDFANGSEFPVVVAREGTVTHVKMSSRMGCESPTCVDQANYVVIDHGDGSASVYLHLAGGSLDPAVRCGEFVRRGQRLASASATGWATGVHLHFQVDDVKDDAPVCECGADGGACAAESAAWTGFWSSAMHPARAVAFDEWAADQCQERQTVLPASTNVDQNEPVYVIDDDSPRFRTGSTATRLATGYHGSLRLAPTRASGEPTAIARYSLAGLVDRPGVFEVWAWASPRRTSPTRRAPVLAVTRGARVRGTLDEGASGGAFHRVEGLGALKLTGAADEVLFVRNDTGERGRTVAFDAILVRRVGDAGPARPGEACVAAVDCAGALVCASGACAQGCDTAGCPAGQTCGALGLCEPGSATAEAQAGDGAMGLSPASRSSVESLTSSGFDVVRSLSP